MKKTTTLKLYSRLLGFIKPYWQTIIPMLLALVVAAGMEPLMPALLKPLVDDTLIAKDPQSITQIPLLLLLVFVVKGFAEYASKVLSEWIAHKAIVDIRYAMFKKLNRLPLGTYQKYSSGKLTSKITYDVLQVGNTLSEAWIIVIRDTLIIMGLLGYLFYTSWQLTLMILLIGPVIGFIIDRASRMMRGSSTEMQNSMGHMTQALEEGILAHKDIKIYGAEAYEENKFHSVADALRKHTMAVIKVSAANVPLVQVLAAAALAAVLYVISLMSAQNLFTPGELIAFIAAMAMIFEPIRRLTNINETIQKGMAAAESIFEILDLPDEKDTGTKTLAGISHNIRFDNVNFRYHPRSKYIIHNLSLDFPINKTTALVGESGSGKTTIANLLARFFRVSDGAIFINEQNINDYSLSSLRAHIAFVSQDVVLFNDTIRANIAYGLSDIDEKDIIDAAKASHSWDFIRSLPEGLDTIIGDKGSNLSGGQKQRIAIARAFLKNAPILIMDEATSALDNQSESMVQQAIDKLRENRTVIIIAHRLSTIESADQIIVLDQGQLVEKGTHEFLLSQEGSYANLYQKGSLDELTK
ncbi:lipid A export permease/ATP-binding protein MsbA [Hydrogenovibrio marinus]|uniref:ABC transporter permease n=1 Tax=Hydrogenovibrio marinus TaxID=28885 RepID=A0A067A1Z5_HYDMR|nr:lipid A export permease/ATP-binding protein MsbA [Hydrogenovibrio marinus]KDN96626.1 ABC transporter permease [Hydrogenovibrio marinus]BBN60164.1 lipid A export ATP-binding/permease protein MsbA [Hydrogenovibrio marinus]